jgi:hypothetical protein
MIFQEDILVQTLAQFKLDSGFATDHRPHDTLSNGTL